MYRPGDRGRLSADGSLDIVGRSNRQVKVRGIRVELGEIESALRGMPPIARACVVADDAGGQPRLAAFVVTDGAIRVDAASLLARMREQVPAHLIPDRLTTVKALPLTLSGKVDYQSLRAISCDSPDADIAPRSEAERQVARLWEELLSISPVGVNCNFFDAGGHSLLAMRLLTRVESRFGVDVSLRALIANPTVEAFAAVIEDALMADLQRSAGIGDEASSE